jgi:2-amino-4-hydroxy-6-hydroxymethyldihydropteridine diphosphokinase
MITVYLALGSNIGNREQNLRRASELLCSANLRIKKVSSIYETEPVDFLEQDWFLNAVLEAETDLSSVDLLQALRAIEDAMGSKKAFAKGPRLIDLDILLYGDESVETPELKVPHPRMLNRKFVLIPLAEIAPDLRHPAWPANAKDLLAKSKDPSEVRKLQ